MSEGATLAVEEELLRGRNRLMFVPNSPMADPGDRENRRKPVVCGVTLLLAHTVV